MGSLCVCVSVGELSTAASHLEVFYQLARSHKWHTDSGENLHRIACEHLRRVYTSMADEVRGKAISCSLVVLCTVVYQTVYSVG